MADEIKTVWLWVCAEGPLHSGYGEHEITQEHVQSLVDYSKMYKAPFLGRSEAVDVEHEWGQAPVWGIIKELKLISPEEAESKGLESRGVNAVYAKVELNERGKWAVENKDFAYTSPGIVFNFKDNSGKEWPLALLELSAVGVPGQNIYNVPAWETTKLAFSQRKSMDVEQVEVMVDETASGELDAIQELLRAVVARLDALEGKQEEAAEAAESEEEIQAVEVLAEAVSELREAVEGILDEKEGSEAALEVDELLETYHCNIRRADLIKMRRKDANTFSALKAALPVKDFSAKRVAGAPAKAAPANAGAVVAKAKDIMRKEGLTFSAALAKASK